jgi:putative transposase
LSDKYKIREEQQAYFVTLTVVDWIDVFTRKNLKLLIIDSLRYCQKFKGLEIYGWCLMSSHLHLIVKATGRQKLPEILRDFKKFTAKAIIAAIIEQPESRGDWMLARFEYNGKFLKRIEKYKFWQDGNHAEIIFTPDFFYQKLNYIHNNPVKEMIASKQEDYYFSSARNYAGLDYLLEVIPETPRLITYT